MTEAQSASAKADVSTVVRPDRELLLGLDQRQYNVFHVPDANGSPFIPAQTEFVVPCGVRSVLGFGGKTVQGPALDRVLGITGRL